MDKRDKGRTERISDLLAMCNNKTAAQLCVIYREKKEMTSFNPTCSVCVCVFTQRTAPLKDIDDKIIYQYNAQKDFLPQTRALHHTVLLSHTIFKI